MSNILFYYPLFMTLTTILCLFFLEKNDWYVLAITTLY